jgi:hypothetical protein
VTHSSLQPARAIMPAAPAPVALERPLPQAPSPPLPVAASPGPASPSTTPTTAGEDLTADVVLAKIQALRVGSTSTWVNAANEMVVLKLSWISPISKKYLFVNKDGARALAGTPKELTGMAHKGRFFPGVTP